jgi:hypothetical protein
MRSLARSVPAWLFLGCIAGAGSVADPSVPDDAAIDGSLTAHLPNEAAGDRGREPALPSAIRRGIDRGALGEAARIGESALDLEAIDGDRSRLGAAPGPRGEPVVASRAAPSIAEGPRASPPDATANACAAPFVTRVRGDADTLVAWAFEAAFVARPGDAELQPIAGLARVTDAGVFPDGSLFVATAVDLHVIAADGSDTVLPLPFDVDSLELSDGWLLALGRAGVAVSADRGVSWRMQETALGTYSRARVHRGFVQVLNVEGLSCEGSWTIQYRGALSAIGRARDPFERRLFPDYREPGVSRYGPSGALSYLEWSFGANGWIYGRHETEVVAVRNGDTRRLRAPVGRSFFQAATNAGETFAIDDDRLLRLTPTGAHVVASGQSERLADLAVDGAGRPLAILDRAPMRFEDRGWRAIAICGRPGLRP